MDGFYGFPSPAQQTVVSASFLVGEVKEWTSDTLPSGWLWCDGAEIGAQYTALEAHLNGTYGRGSNNRSLTPDRRGRVAIGKDNMGGAAANRVTAIEADVLGGSGGEETTTLIETQLSPHNHRQNRFSTSGGATVRNNGAAGSGTASGAIWTENSGGGEPHNNLQPYLTQNFIIYAGG